MSEPTSVTIDQRRFNTSDGSLERPPGVWRFFLDDDTERIQLRSRARLHFADGDRDGTVTELAHRPLPSPGGIRRVKANVAVTLDQP